MLVLESDPTRTFMNCFRASLAALLLPLAACQFVPEKGIEVSSAPPGARIYVDGRDSGFVTPCVLGVDDDPHRVELELDGYRRETRLLTTGGQTYLIYWNEAFLTYDTWRFPLWLNWLDGLFPLKLVDASSPSRIFVRLRRAQEE